MGISFVVHAIRGERFLTVGASCVQDDSSDKPAKKSAARTGTQRGRPVFLREERHSRVALFPYIADVNRTSRGLWCVLHRPDVHATTASSDVDGGDAIRQAETFRNALETNCAKRNDYYV